MIDQWLDAAAIPYTVWDVPGRPFDFEPEGILVHHTGGTFTSANYVANIGRTTVPPPLYSVLVYRDTEVHWITDGRSNNAGLGDSAYLIPLRADLPPDPDAPQGEIIGGNKYFYGVSMQGRGSTHTPEQIELTKKVVAAICIGNGWSENKVLGHKEWAGYRGKIDPELDMDAYRADVKGLIDVGRLEQELTDDQITYLIDSVKAETDAAGFNLSPTSKGHTVEWLRATAEEAGIPATDEDALADWIANSPNMTPAALIALLADEGVQATLRGIIGDSILNG